MEVFAAIQKPRFLWQLWNTMDISGSSAWALKSMILYDISWWIYRDA